MASIRVAVAGQPNCGKSTMFNAITGGSARVGNYPGITVDRLEGRYKLNNQEFHLVDLPGTYSLTAYSLEEVVARDVIVNERPDVVLCMLDSTALERSLYLVVQIMEMEVPMVLGLNMMDEARHQGLNINSAKLAELLDVPVVECVARVGEGREELMESIALLVDSDQLKARPFKISYGPQLDPIIESMARLIEDRMPPGQLPPARWLALKVLEDDKDVLNRLRPHGDLADKLLEMAAEAEARVKEHGASYPEALISDRRYDFINSLVEQGVISRENDLLPGYSSKADKVLTHRLLGPLILLGVLWSMFYITFILGAAPQGWLQTFFNWLAYLGNTYIPEGMLRSMIVSGMLDGVGAVLSFTPLILIMFTMLCFLEDLGYMARVAYMVDRIFRSFGLHGMSVMPLVMAGGMPGGCAVPGVMCCRTLRSPKERLATILTAPFMVCGAKTTAYIVLTAAFFSHHATLAMFLVVITSWLFVLLVSRLLRWTVIKGRYTPFVMELPPYRLPTVRGVAAHAWERVWLYIKKAGTVILAMSILMWALMTFPQLPASELAKYDQMRKQVAAQTKHEHKGMAPAQLQKWVQAGQAKIDKLQGTEALKNSYAGRVSAFIKPLTDLAGFPWQANISFVGAFAAKEVFVSTMATAYSMGDVDPDYDVDADKSLAARIGADPAWTAPVIGSVFLFLLLYTPCMITVVTIARETNWKWALLSVVGSLTFALVVSVTVYQVMSRLM